MNFAPSQLLTIYAVMFRIGAFTFGGGWSIISQVQEAFVDRRGWLKEEQIVDFMSLARTFPGIMVVNFSILSGHAMGGIPGAVSAAFGLVSPAVLVIALVACFYDFISSNPYVIRVMNGIRSAVVPIVLLASWKLKNSALGTGVGLRGPDSPDWGPQQAGRPVPVRFWLLLLLAGAAFGVCAFTSVPKSVTILVGAAIGFLIQRGGGKEDAVS